MVLLLTNIMSSNNQRLLFFCMGSAFTFMALVTFRVENLIIPDQFYQAEIQHLEQSFFSGGSSGNHATSQHQQQQQQQMIISQAKAELARQKKEFRQKHGAAANNVNINTIDTSAYQDPLPLNLTKSQRRSLPLPVQIMERYRKQHSVESLRQDPNPHKRKFAIGFYVCPLSAGNRMHEFFNYMLWAVVTNRTLLWKYYDKETCEMYAPKLHQDPIHCQVANMLDDCDQILERAPWIPSYDEWTKKLNIKPKDVTLLPRSLNNPKFNAKNRFDKSKTGADNRYADERIVLFPRRTNVLDFLNDSDIMKKKLKTKYGQKTVKGMFDLGINFLYGMLHRYSFDFHTRIKRTVPATLLDGSSSMQSQRRAMSLESDFTMAVHSRHNDSRIDGCDISKERHCVEKMLKKKSGSKQCRVAVMADRVCTISTLTDWLTKEKNCVVEVAKHEAGNGTYAEHGPFAGSGYFQDLALASVLTRDAIVGSELHGGLWRSSSLLLMELVDFHKRMEAHFDDSSNGASIEHVTFDECMLPKNNLVCNKGWGEC